MLDLKPTITEVHQRNFEITLTPEQVSDLINAAVREACGAASDATVTRLRNGDHHVFLVSQDITPSERPASAPVAPMAVDMPKNQTPPSSAPQNASTGQAKVNRFTNQWTPADDARILDLIAQGRTVSGIGQLMGRTTRAVEQRLTKLRKAGRGVAQTAENRPEPQQNKAVGVLPKGEGDRPPEGNTNDICEAPAPSKLQKVQIAPDPSRPLWWREIEANLNALGSKAPWTPALDVALVEGLMRGTLAEDLADQLGVEVAEFRTRLIAMTPDCVDHRGKRSVTIEHQKRLLEVLKARAA